MGMVNYYGKVIKNLAEMTAPIYNLLKKGETFRWGEQQQNLLNKIKAEIDRRQALKPFDTDSHKKVILKTNASDEGMGAVLEQQQSNGEYEPILY